MSDRRALRGSQVRPRPASSGRPRPIPDKLRPRPSPYRIAQHKRVATGPRIPFIGRAILALAVVALSAVVLYSATGQIGRIVGSVGGAVSSFLANAGTAPTTSVPSEGPVAGAPTIVAPSSAYTSEATVDITGTVPITIIGSTDYTISLYQALQGQKPTLIQHNVAIPQTATFTIPGVKLLKGTNVFTATIVGPGGESSPSSPVTIVLDTAKPKLTIVSPKDGTKVNGTSVDITGRTQASSTILAQNGSNHTSVTTTADQSGAFKITVAITAGLNAITITATDPASNATTTSLSLTRGAGKLTLGLISNWNSFSAKKGVTLILTATLTDPNGQPIVGQSVTMTISIAGLGPDVRAGLTTDSAGKVTVTYPINKHAADQGAGKWGQVTATADTTFGHVQKTISIKTEQ